MPLLLFVLGRLRPEDAAFAPPAHGRRDYLYLSQKKDDPSDFPFSVRIISMAASHACWLLA